MWYKLKGILAFTYIAVNLGLWIIPLFLVAMVKLLIPIEGVRKICYLLMTHIYTLAAAADSFMLRYFANIDIEVTGLNNVNRNSWYLIIANHQTWSDAIVMQTVFNRKMPVLKFIVKQQIIFVPFVGLVCWAFDFPIVKRYSKTYLQKHPERKDHDKQQLKEACHKFTKSPSSIMNFVEGTRFTSAKHKRQNSPYQHLLTPKPKGMAVTLEVLKSHLTKILNTTIVYDIPITDLTFLDFLGGKCKKIVVIVEEINPSQILETITSKETSKETSNELSNEEDLYLIATIAWLTETWQKKDKLITQIKKTMDGK